MRLWIEESVAADVVDHAKRAYPLETGGLLVGYFTPKGPVVTGIIGPGEAATATGTSFVPDTAFQQNAVNQIYERSQGQDTYLGDWHSHPDGLAEPSWRDRKTLRSIARDRAARLPHATMLIVAGAEDAWHFSAFVGHRHPWPGWRIRTLAITTFVGPRTD